MYIFFFSFVLAQDYNYLLEDINPSSPTYGEMIGPSSFPGKSTVHIFSHQG